MTYCDTYQEYLTPLHQLLLLHTVFISKKIIIALQMIHFVLLLTIGKIKKKLINKGVGI